MILRLNYRHSRNGTPAQLPTTLGTSIGTQSPRADRPKLSLAGEYFQAPSTSLNGFQTNRDTMAIPFLSESEPIVNNRVSIPTTNTQAFQIRNAVPMGAPFGNLGPLTLFGPAGYTNPVALTHLMQQSQSSSTTGNGQGNFPAPGIQVVDGR